MGADLFGGTSGADISPCGTYRWRLWRRWGTGPHVCWVMLNPSTADAESDDPTVRRCIRFSEAWGYGGLVIGNLYPLRSSDPRDLAKWVRLLTTAADISVAMWTNINVVLAQAESAVLVVAAWGAFPPKLGAYWRPVTMLNDWCRGHHKPLQCLGTTRDGHPKHPLARGRHRVPDDQRPVPWERS